MYNCRQTSSKQSELSSQGSSTTDLIFSTGKGSGSDTVSDLDSEEEGFDPMDPQHPTYKSGYQITSRIFIDNYQVIHNN